MIKRKLLNNFILFSFSFFLFISCIKEDKQNAIITEKSNEIYPDQISYNTEVAFVDSSFTKAILNAGRARVYKANNETLLDSSVKVRFFTKDDNKKNSVLTCDSARIDENTNNMFAYGNVIVRSESQNMTLKTSVLEWKNYQQRLYSTEYVEIITEHEILRGYGFESDPDLKDYRIFNISGSQNIRR